MSQYLGWSRSGSTPGPTASTQSSTTISCWKLCLLVLIFEYFPYCKAFDLTLVKQDSVKIYVLWMGKFCKKIIKNILGSKFFKPSLLNTYSSRIFPAFARLLAIPPPTVAQNRGSWGHFRFWPYSLFLLLFPGSVKLGEDTQIRWAGLALHWKLCFVAKITIMRFGGQVQLDEFTVPKLDNCGAQM